MSYLDRRLDELFGGTLLTTGKVATPVTDELDLKYGSDFDIVKLMEEAEDPDSGTIRDLKIDDREHKGASSYYDFAFTTIGKDAHPPWLIQMWTGLLLFGEVCTVCSNKKWLNLRYIIDNVDKATPSEEIVENIKVLRNGMCPKCKRHKWDLIQNHGLHNYVELVNVLGQRSGKSASAASYAAYGTHRMLKFPRLADLTKAMQKSTELTATFVSLTFGKAVGLLWTPYKNIIDESQWFQDYFSMLDGYAEQYGIELYRKKDEFFKFFHRNLKCYPTHPKGKTLRGDTRIMAIIDELGLFPLPKGNDEEDETSEIANADEAHKSLTNSLTTVQSVVIELLKKGMNPPPALMMGVSSPMSARDKVMRLLDDAKTENGRKYILGVNLPTWNVNPNIHRDSPMIVLAYERNAEKAERDFGATPPRVHNTLVKPSQVRLSLWSQRPTHSMTYQYDRPGELYAKVHLNYSPKYPSVVCLDAGHTNNSFTLVGAHFDKLLQKTVVSTVLEIMTHDGRRIDFNAVYTHVILPVMKDINAVVLFADQWQSIDLLSRAKEDMGTAVWAKGKNRLVSKQYSPKRADFDTLISMMENGSLILPQLSEADYQDVLSRVIEYKTLNGMPAKHLLLQLLTIVDAGPGKAPTKGSGYTDDILRALVLTTLIHKEKVFQRLQEADVEAEASKRRMPAPIYISRGG